MARAQLLLLGSILISCAGCDQLDRYSEGSVPPPVLVTGEQPTPLPDILQPDAIAARGEDFRSPRYDPQRIGKPLDQIDTTYDYDFAELAEVEATLSGLSRRAALAEIFAKVTSGASSDTERHLRVLDFLQRASVHSGYLQPMYPDGTMVSDPLVLLALNEMRCGHVAMVAVDLFASAGYPGRLVQLGGHIIAEIKYDGHWHYFDADLFGGGQVVRDFDGSIPSVVELSHEPQKLDALTASLEVPLAPGADGSATGSAPFASYFYFSRQAYIDSGLSYPGYLSKTATATQEEESRYYGWEHLHWTAATTVQLQDAPLRWQPGAPRFASINRLSDGRIHLAWNPPDDPDGDVSSYVVTMSPESRGWHYDVSDDYVAQPFVTAGWLPEMYPSLFASRNRPSAIATTSTEITFGPIQEPVFVSVVAIDAYGEAVGGSGGFESYELRFTAN